MSTSRIIPLAPYQDGTPRQIVTRSITGDQWMHLSAQYYDGVAWRQDGAFIATLCDLEVIVASLRESPDVQRD
jgi:hypothetical protein